MDPKDLSRLAPELLKLAPERAAARMDALSLDDRVELVLAVPNGRQRMDLILSASRPQELVQALPPEDLVLTIKDIGDQDAVPLLELTSDPQLTYLFDLELWFKAGMDLSRLNHWLNILFECGDQRVLRWILSVDFELLVLVLERTVLSISREELENLPELLNSRLYTPDDTHFLLIKLGAEYTLIKQLMDLVFAYQRDMFFALMGNLGTTPLAELEEQALRWRNGRLSDRGWPDLDEALELYQPTDRLDAHAPAGLPLGLDNPPRYPLQASFAGRLLAEGIQQLSNEQLRSRVATQLANLINRVIISDGMIPGETDSLERAARRVQGRLEIGLALLGAKDAGSSAACLSSTPLLHVFQAAQGAIRQRVERLRRLQVALPGEWFGFLQSPQSERFVALTGTRALFVPHGSILFEEFSGPADLSALDRDLDLTEALVGACQALQIDGTVLPDPFPAGSHPPSVEGLTFETLLLTGFARSRVGLAPRPEPFPAGRLADLFGSLPPDPGRLREEIQTWLEGFLESRPAGLETLVDRLTRLMTDQILAHRPEELDPRFIEGLWIRVPD